MKNELISVETEDGIVLHGALYEAPAAKETAVIMQHGAAMNFYTGMGRFLPAILVQGGYSCFSANNRGHDFGTAPDNDKKPVIGLMRDTFKECVKDARALIALMKGRGYQRLVLLGHSQAIPKIVYAQNLAQFPEVAGLILISSPPSVTQMMRYLATEDFYERGLFKARELSELGMGDQLIVLKGRGTMPWIFTARTFLDFYGPGTPADTEELVRQVYCPILLTRGSQDFPPVTRELLQRIKINSAHPDKTQVVEIAGADHFYIGYEDELGEKILDWLNGMV
ncbi:MAG: alpha/beta hydrolase [Syntrophomonadaceae bacterium]|jgi:pimeloyl-ACP methyl ester carboxylesterase|nr:alpha/beta hydrolase [Syntrophomonadaceae bacterium]